MKYKKLSKGVRRERTRDVDRSAHFSKRYYFDERGVNVGKEKCMQIAPAHFFKMVTTLISLC